MEGVCQKLGNASHSPNSYLWSFRLVTQISYFSLFSRQLEVKKIHWKLKEMSGRGPLQYSLRVQPLSLSFPMYFGILYFCSVSHTMYFCTCSHTHRTVSTIPPIAIPQIHATLFPANTCTCDSIIFTNLV
jgi:hypothetical protein